MKPKLAPGLYQIRTGRTVATAPSVEAAVQLASALRSAPRFYVGLHQPSDARHFERCMVSVNRLRERKSDFVVEEWMLDSAAFTELSTHGAYRHTVADYAEQIRRWARCGQLVSATAQDYMCEPFILAKTGMVLASGHMHISETWIVLEEAKKRGVKRMCVTHPEEIVDGSLNDVKGLAAMGAFIEHSVCMFLDGSKFQHRREEELGQFIEAAGVDQTVMGSDLGQPGTFLPLDGMRRAVKLCIRLGYSDEDIRKMFSLNTARMLGIEADLPAKN